MLSSVLDAGMTQKLVRLGSRSADERISQFSIENMEMVQGKSRLDRTLGHQHRELKEVEEEVKQLMSDFLKADIDSDSIVQYLELNYPEHHEHIINPPAWILAIKSINSDDGEKWQQIGKRGRGEKMDHSMYAYWKSGQDLIFVDALDHQTPLSTDDCVVHPVGQSGNNMFSILADPETTSQVNEDAIELEDDESEIGDEDLFEELWMKVPLDQQRDISTIPMQDSLLADVSAKVDSPSNLIQPSDLRDPADFFVAYGCDNVPVVPTSDRTLQVLIEFGDIWSMSRLERQCLHKFWTESARLDLHNNQLEDFERLRRKHADKLRRVNEGKDEVGELGSIPYNANGLHG